MGIGQHSTGDVNTDLLHELVSPGGLMLLLRYLLGMSTPMQYSVQNNGHSDNQGWV